MVHVKKWLSVVWSLGLLWVVVSGCRKPDTPPDANNGQLPSMTVVTQKVMPVVSQLLTNLTSSMMEGITTGAPSQKYLGSGLLAEEVRRLKNNITQSGVIRKDVRISNIEISALDSESRCLLARVTGQVVTEKGTNQTRWNLLIELHGTNAIPRIVGMSEMNEAPAAKATAP
jgi:hypothetical protein